MLYIEYAPWVQEVLFVAHSLHHSAMKDYREHQMWSEMCRQNGICVDGNKRRIRTRLWPGVILYPYPPRQ